jgi:nucleoside-diphosphate-sugar epimerase
MQDSKADPLTTFNFIKEDIILNLVCQAATVEAERFVFFRSVKVNGETKLTGRAFTEADLANPQDAYGQSNREAEQGLRQVKADTGMEVFIIRPSLGYGPGNNANFASLKLVLQRAWPFPPHDAHNQLSFVALDNLVDFIVTCITHQQAVNQAFFVSHGQDLSTMELVRDMAKATGVPALFLPVPAWAFKAGDSLPGKGDAVQRLCSNLQFDMSTASSLLNWVLPVSFDEGLRGTIAV